MELERLAVALRPRNAWEAIDLGIRLAVLNARPLYAAWLGLTLPVALLVLGLLGLTGGHPLLAFGLLWWLKPLFDRIALHVMSHAVFGDTPGARASLRALPGLLRRPGLWRALSYGRFDPRRSLRLPVDLLEGLRGKAGRARRRLISRRYAGSALWLTAAWSYLEVLFVLGVVFALLLFTPVEVLTQLDWRTLFSDTNQQSLTLGLVALQTLAALLLEPLYVSAGFMLYLKRRSDLEGWDIELQFRRLAQAEARKHAAGDASGIARAAVLAMLALLVGTALLPAPARAQTAAAQREHTIDQAGDAIKKVMQAPDFGTREKTHQLRWVSDEDTQQGRNLPAWLQSWLEALARGLTALAKLIAGVGRVLGWAAIAALVLGVGVLLLRQGRGWRFGATPALPPAELAGFDIRPQSLPADVAAAARELARAGRSRDALSLLFRGALSALAHRDGVPFSRGDTEGDCHLRVLRHAHVHARVFAQLLARWQAVAYAHRDVAQAEIETLCGAWAEHFAMP